MTAHNHANHNDTKQQPDDAVAMLTADHRQVRALLQQYAQTPEPYLQQIIAEHVFAELTLHLLQEVEEDAAFETGFQALRDHVNQHFEGEETTMFPQAAQVLATHWEEITVLLQERKAQILAS